MKKISRFFTTFLTVVALILHLYGPWALVIVEAGDPTPNWPTSWTTPSDCSTDPSGDESPSNLDIASSTSWSAVGYAIDSNYMYFKERIKGNPAGPGGFDQKAWVVLFQTTTPGYQYLVSLNGKDDLVQVWQNTSEAGPVDFSPLLNDPAENVLWSGPASFYAHQFGVGGGTYYVYWAVPISVLSNLGITASTTKFFATSADANNFNKDYLDCYESAGPVCGNGQIESPEVCDSNSTSCTTQDGYAGSKLCNQTCDGWGICQATEYCGDGIVNGPEQCDDNNNQNGDGCSATCQIETCNLFFSEYVEGSSNNKALEIYNKSANSINLNGYKVEIYNNGANTPTSTINLNNVSLASGDVYVLVKNNASSELLNKADQTSSNLSFNGDDAIVLKYNSTIIDVIGQIGYDPGEKWGVEPITTKDHTLVRKCGITCGDQNGNDVFDPSIEWDSYNKDDFSHLGEHDPICCICGDGIVNGNEQCDDGNNSNNDACLNDCTNASCGDGYLWFGIEECDGDQPKLCQTENGYLGNQSCNLDCKWGECISFESCGDGIVNGSEQCDEGENNGKTCTPEYGSSCNYCSENCTLETLQGPYCGDGVKNGSEECDGTDGVISGENFCVVNCKLIPIYDGPSTCPEGMVKSQNPIWSGIISATDPDGENINLAGGKYLLEVSGTFKPTSGNGWWSDAGYTTNNNWLSLATQYGIGGTGSDYAAHALLSDFGSGKVGVVNWGTYNNLHIYTKYYEANNTNFTRFVIGDRYGDWFNTPWQNQTGMFDNQGGLNLNIYNCYQVGSISGHAWEDKDGDGNWDTGEPVINGENIPGGLTIFIDLDGDGEQESGDPRVDIASDGSFLFDNLLADTYNVCERDDLLSGWIATSPRCQIVDVNEGQNSEVNFGNFKLGAIQGRKFEDLNQDGNRDQGEPYLNDWLIRIYKKNGTIWDLLGERITGHTGKQGQYRIEGLTLGKYKICEVLQNSWLQTAPTGVQNREREDEAPRCRLVLITESGQEKTGVSFGNVKKGSISGYKFEDLDKDGEKDENEKGIEGWKICLVSNAQYILSDNLENSERSLENCVFTDENGYYFFADVIPGTYLVEEETRDGWIATTATSIPIILESGQNYTNQNFGNLGLPKFGVTKKNNVAVFVNPNYKVTYTITITNYGFGPAMNFEVKDALPIGFNYVAGTSTITGATGSGPVIDGNTNTLTWLIDWLDAGSSMTITYDVLVLPSVLAGTYTNTVTVEDASAGSSVEVRIPIVAGETIEKEETITETTSTPTKTQPEGKVLGESISTGGSPWTYLLISFLISVALYLTYSRAQLNKRRLVEERENSIQ